MEFIVSAGTYAKFCHELRIDTDINYRHSYIVEFDDDLNISNEDELLKALNKGE